MIRSDRRISMRLMAVLAGTCALALTACSSSSSSSTAFAGLDTQGLLLKGFEPNVQWNSLGTESVPSDKSYTPTGVTLMAALAYNKQKVKSPPTTWQALLSSQWKGQVGMNDPSQSGPTFPFIAGMMNYLGGVSAGESYFTKLKANGLVIHPTNGPRPSSSSTSCCPHRASR